MRLLRIVLSVLLDALLVRSGQNGRLDSGICACFDDMQSCCVGLLCPCYLFGKNAEFLDTGTFMGSCVTHFLSWVLLNSLCCLCTDGACALLGLPGCFIACYACGYRRALRTKYNLPEAPCGDLVTHFFCHLCSVCQEYREITERSGNSGQIEISSAAVTAPMLNSETICGFTSHIFLHISCKHVVPNRLKALIFFLSHIHHLPPSMVSLSSQSSIRLNRFHATSAIIRSTKIISCPFPSSAFPAVAQKTSSPVSFRIFQGRFREAEDESDGGSSSRLNFNDAVQLFNAREYYACHDVLETLWNNAEDRERTLYHGILQCAVGLHHLFNQNHKGAMMELGEGLCKLRKMEFGTGPFLEFEQEIAAALEFIYQTQIELAACAEDLCLAMDQTERSYQLLGGYAAGQHVYYLEFDDLNGVMNIVFRPDKSYATLEPQSVKLPILPPTEEHHKNIQ